ncbi:alkaline serine protease AorO [Acrodontium crateriforme]|uniref:tripeptidyl-peptidase II n=1 Tax=Acrodontium crateriforme TaxID=150365 RepID=A0AAQ3MCW9_9PEZI|nr:alkaline serine protease AorO [Acrodontium crateriforme]
MRLSCAALVAALAASAEALAVPHALHEKRETPTRNWQKRSPVAREIKMPMRIGMKQSNLHQADALLLEISDPDSPKYGKHYSQDEVIELFAPSDLTVSAIRSWLESAGIAAHRISVSANKQWIQFDADVDEAEGLFKTKYYNYEHEPTGRKSIATDEYHVPAHIQEHIDYVLPGLRLMAGGKATPAARQKNTKRGISGPIIGSIIGNDTVKAIQKAELTMCDQYITPPCVAAMYNITQATKAAKGNELGIFEEGDFYGAEDLAEFFTLFAQNIPIGTEPILEGVDGGFAPGLYATGESDLDFQLAYPIVYPQQTILFQTDDIFYATGLLSLSSSSGFLNTFFDAIDGSYCDYTAYGETGDSSIDPEYPDPNPLGYQGQRMCGKYKPANVISISYGEQEDDLPTNYQQRQCSEIMKLGMQGVTVVLASGDSGVAARSTDDGNSDGCLGTGQVFSPDFPASCPYVLGVGATLLTGDVSKDEEVAVTRFPSGGGFSNIYPTPDYQKDAVTGYISQYTTGYKSYNFTTPTNNPTPAQYGDGIFNNGGRGYPDVSAVGDNVVVITNGMPTLIGGTSASAPVVASILNRINEERIAAGKSTIGFVNPTLYKNPSAFHDITVGSNAGCGTNGFSVSPGWDPITGLGTPNYPALLDVFMALP